MFRFISFFDHIQCVQDHLVKRRRNLSVVHNEDASFIFFLLRQHHRRIVGTAESAADRHIQDLFIFFECFVPDFHHSGRRWLGSRNIGSGCQLFKKQFPGKRHTLIIALPVDIERHRQNKDPEFLCLFLADAAVTVCYDSNFLHICISSLYPGFTQEIAVFCAILTFCVSNNRNIQNPSSQ